jgi:hypothetical protein
MHANYRNEMTHAIGFLWRSSQYYVSNRSRFARIMRNNLEDPSEQTIHLLEEHQ